MTGLGFTIGVDVDDVLFPWSVEVHDACEEAGITNGRRITQWEAWQDYQCSEQEFWDVVHTAYRNGLLLNAEPAASTLYQLERLQSEGHIVHLVTARGFEGPLAEQVRDDTRTWLRKHKVKHDALTFIKDKTRVATDYFLDDSIPNVTALRAVGVEAYLHHQDHNAADTVLPRVNSIREFADIVVRETRLMAECK